MWVCVCAPPHGCISVSALLGVCPSEPPFPSSCFLCLHLAQPCFFPLSKGTLLSLLFVHHSRCVCHCVSVCVCARTLTRARTCMDIPAELPLLFSFWGLWTFLSLSPGPTVRVSGCGCTRARADGPCVSQAWPGLAPSFSTIPTLMDSSSVCPSIHLSTACWVNSGQCLPVLSLFLSLLFSHCPHTPQTRPPLPSVLISPNAFGSPDPFFCFLSLQPQTWSQRWLYPSTRDSKPLCPPCSLECVSLSSTTECHCVLGLWPGAPTLA